MNDEKERQVLASTMALLETANKEVTDFYHIFHEQFQNAKETFQKYTEVVNLYSIVLEQARKNTKDYSLLTEAHVTHRHLHAEARLMRKLLEVPSEWIKTGDALANLAARVAGLSRLVAVPQTNESEEDRILDKLTTEQLQMVSRWVAENEART